MYKAAQARTVQSKIDTGNEFGFQIFLFPFDNDFEVIFIPKSIRNYINVIRSIMSSFGIAAGDYPSKHIDRRSKMDNALNTTRLGQLSELD